MNTIYTYREAGRRPVTYLATAVFIAVLAAAFYHQAPWFFFPPVLLGGALLLYMLVTNPVNGLLLTDTDLVLSPWRAPRVIPLDRIARIEIIDHSDSRDLNIHLTSGEVISAASGDIPPASRFGAALAGVDIVLERH